MLNICNWVYDGATMWWVADPAVLQSGGLCSLDICIANFSSTFLQYFTGNRDQNSVVQHGLYPRIKAYTIRVHPWGWYRHISMRVEFYGCTEGEFDIILAHYVLDICAWYVSKKTLWLFWQENKQYKPLNQGNIPLLIKWWYCNTLCLLFIVVFFFGKKCWHILSLVEIWERC